MSDVREKAVKFDGGKTRLELLPFDALSEVADVLAFGAQKYGEHNWCGGMRWSSLIGAALRHIFAWAMGQDKDPETGLSHLAHAGCCILFLIAYQRRGVGEDDRFKVPAPPEGAPS